jgi:hypothetical protein
MSEEQQFLSQILRRTSLSGDEAQLLLRRLLQSQADGAANGHLAAGRALFAAAESASEIEKRLLYDQIFFCLMRALEDFAMLCLMGWDESRHPLDIYLNLDRPELRAFFSRARKGFGEEIIYKLMGVGSWPTLKKMAIFRGKDFSSDESALDWVTQDAKEILVRYGKLYHTTFEDADTVLGPWQIAYAKAPIGLKLLLNNKNDTAEILMGAEQADPTTKGPSVAFSAPVNVDTNFAEKVLFELEGVCQQLKRLARRRLLLIDDPAVAARSAKGEWQEHLNRLAGRKPKEVSETAEADTSPESTPPEAKSELAASPEPKPELHSETRHDVEPHKIMEVGGLKIIHSKKIGEE